MERIAIRPEGRFFSASPSMWQGQWITAGALAAAVLAAAAVSVALAADALATAAGYLACIPHARRSASRIPDPTLSRIPYPVIPYPVSRYPISRYPGIPYPVSRYPVSHIPVSRIPRDTKTCIPYPFIPCQGPICIPGLSLQTVGLNSSVCRLVAELAHPICRLYQFAN